MNKILGIDKMDFIGHDGNIYTCGVMFEFGKEINAICYQYPHNIKTSIKNHIEEIAKRINIFITINKEFIPWEKEYGDFDTFIKNKLNLIEYYPQDEIEKEEYAHLPKLVTLINGRDPEWKALSKDETKRIQIFIHSYGL